MPSTTITTYRSSLQEEYDEMRMTMPLIRSLIRGSNFVRDGAGQLKSILFYYKVHEAKEGWWKNGTNKISQVKPKKR